MAAITGTSEGDNLAGTLDADTIDALGGDDRIRGSQGSDVIDGGNGTDYLSFCLVCSDPEFPEYNGPVNYTLTDQSFSDSLGWIDTSFNSIERFTFSSANAGMVTFDASEWTPSPSDERGYLLISLWGSNRRVTGSSFDDYIQVQGKNHVIDGGAGHDYVYTSTNGWEDTIFITTVGDVTRITQNAGFDSDRTSITAIGSTRTIFSGSRHTIFASSRSRRTRNETLPR